MKYKVQGTHIMHNGKWYAPDDDIELTAEQAEKLEGYLTSDEETQKNSSNRGVRHKA